MIAVAPSSSIASGAVHADLSDASAATNRSLARHLALRLLMLRSSSVLPYRLDDGRRVPWESDRSRSGRCEATIHTLAQLAGFSQAKSAKDRIFSISCEARA
jgi:hypothetical protein